VLRAGTAATITFVRTSDKTHGTEVVFPSLNRRALPLKQPIVIEAPAAGERRSCSARTCCVRAFVE